VDVAKNNIIAPNTSLKRAEEAANEDVRSRNDVGAPNGFEKAMARILED
jgi:hypothetical protein